MSRIDKEDALRIKKKLKAKTQGGRRAHDLAIVYDGDVPIASFGIRHGSDKSLGHGHIPKDLYLTEHQTYELKSCTMTRDEWLEIARQVPPAERSV